MVHFKEISGRTRKTIPFQKYSIKMSLISHCKNILHNSRKPWKNFKGSENPFTRATKSRSLWMGSTFQIFISSYILAYSGPNTWSATSLWHTWKHKFNSFFLKSNMVTFATVREKCQFCGLRWLWQCLLRSTWRLCRTWIWVLYWKIRFLSEM